MSIKSYSETVHLIEKFGHRNVIQWIVCVCRIIEGLTQAKLEAGKNGDGLQSLLDAFKASLVQQNLPDKVAKTVKELHSSVSRLGKVRGNLFRPSFGGTGLLLLSK